MHETLAKQMALSAEHGCYLQIALESRAVFSSKHGVGCPQRPCHTLAVISTHAIA